VTRRYFTRPRSFYVEDETYRDPVNLGTPIVSEHVATDTGLLDARGDTIWRAPPPMGFQFEDDR
jgi:hypothetical protein